MYATYENLWSVYRLNTGGRAAKFGKSRERSAYMTAIWLAPIPAVSLSAAKSPNPSSVRSFGAKYTTTLIPHN